MFDWARGSMLKKFVELKMFRADWTRTDWLKNWHVPWLLDLQGYAALTSDVDS